MTERTWLTGSGCCPEMKTVRESQEQQAPPTKESQTRRRGRRKFRELEHERLQADTTMHGMPALP